MQAIRVHQYGGPEQLKLEQVVRPTPQAGEVLIQIHAAGVLPAEWKALQGLFHTFRPAIFPYIPGSAVVGVVAGVGPGVTAFRVGQAVFGRSVHGTYAEYTATEVEPPALTPAMFSLLALTPAALSFDAAATISGGATTAWQALFADGELQAGQRVLIHGAAGGVGSFAVQFARWKGAHVIGTASRANLDFVRSLGAETVIDRHNTIRAGGAGCRSCAGHHRRRDASTVAGGGQPRGSARLAPGAAIPRSGAGTWYSGHE